MPWALLLGMVITQSLHAQFMVQPMIYEISTLARERLQAEIILQNMDNLDVKYASVKLVELGQLESGTWDPIDANDPLDAAKIAGHQSCKDWIRMGVAPGETIEIPLMDSRHIPLEIEVPVRVRGFYTAGIVVSLLPRPGETGVTVRYDFVVPILITIEGRALPKRIGLVDAGLEFVQGSGTASDRTFITLGVENTGSTYAKIVGVAQLTQKLKDDRTRLVKKDIVFDVVGIIPGSRLRLREDLFRTLPTGTYEVTGALYIDGRHSRPIRKVVEYISPDGSDGLARGDAAIWLDPLLVEIEASPGRRSKTIVTISNNADEAVTVKSSLLVPEGLVNRALLSGERLEELSCAGWLSVKPQEFTLKAFSKRNLQLSLRMPGREGLPQWSYQPGAYYANLRLYGFYGDGQLAGVIDTHVSVKDKTVQASVNVIVKQLKIEAAGKSKFDVVATFVNRSLIDIEPICMVGVYALDGSADGEQVSYDRLQNSRVGDAIMLPFEERDFSKQLDFSRRPAGNYRVDALFVLGEEAGGQPIRRSKQIEIFIRRDGVERAVLFR
ncbi:MAG: hypothetical protein IIA65_03180 [Planctomycetes bacterium]|nr:hypothetical protein [Planctomycetota bacterium]